MASPSTLPPCPAPPALGWAWQVLTPQGAEGARPCTRSERGVFPPPPVLPPSAVFSALGCPVLPQGRFPSHRVGGRGAGSTGDGREAGTQRSGRGGGSAGPAPPVHRLWGQTGRPGRRAAPQRRGPQAQPSLPAWLLGLRVLRSRGHRDPHPMSPRRPCCSSPPSSPFPRRLLLQPPWSPAGARLSLTSPTEDRLSRSPRPSLAPEHDWSSCPGSGSVTLDPSAGRPLPTSSKTHRRRRTGRKGSGEG